MQAATGAGRVTISMVAREAGLTKGTVSRALNGYADIAEPTRQRVERLAARMGYRPLSQAQAIRTGRTQALGFVLQVDEHDGHAPFLADFLAGATEAAGQAGWTLTMATAASGEAMRDVMQGLIEDRKADGFILQRTLRDDPRIAWAREAGVPFVLYGRAPDTDGISYYDIRGGEAMASSVERLVALGHRRLAMVTGAEAYHYSHLRADGFARACAEAGIDAPILWGSRTAADGERLTARLLREHRPTGIVYALDTVALGGYRAIEAAGLVVGRDVSVMGYDGMPEAAHARPALTTWRVDARAAGAALARMLIERIRGEASPEALRWLARPTLIEGGSVGPAPGETPREGA